MPQQTAYLRGRAKVAASLASVAGDPQVASLLHQVAEEFEEEACKRELEIARRDNRVSADQPSASQH